MKPSNFKNKSTIEENVDHEIYAGRYVVVSEGGVMFHCGKKAAGRLLDGREWNQFPAINMAQ
ncbi:MAG: hypothetical protein KDE46_03145 [Caldilineaceae bacterium]|nr:hypothetical protein [Caldilineaceae bacterium]